MDTLALLAFYPPEIPPAEYGAYTVEQDAKELLAVPVEHLAPERQAIENARDVLNRLLERIDRHAERAGTAALPLEMRHV